jgi:hypothetical protein
LLAAAATETDENDQTVDWVRATINDPHPLNYIALQQMWRVCNSVGEAFTPGVNDRLAQDVSPFEFFMFRLLQDN